MVSLSCKKGLQPEAPEETYSSTNKIPERNISYLNMPLEISIKDIQHQINSNLPQTLYNDQSFEDDDLKMKISKKGSFIITGTNNDIFSFEIPLEISATKQLSVLGFKQAASSNFEMKIKFSSKFFLGNEWTVNTDTKVEGFGFITEPKASVAGFTVPIKGIVEKVLVNYQPYIARQIDEQVIQNIVIKPQVLNVWNSLKKPILISQEYNTWLKVQPQDMLIGPIKSTTDKVFINIVMKAFVDTFTGQPNEGEQQVSIDLPPLKFVANAPGGFNINVSNLITFEEAEKIAKGMFVGRTFKFKNDKYILNIDALKLYGSTNDQMVIQLKVSGSLDGLIFLKGTPELNKTKNQIELRNLDFDLKTQNVLLKSASWLLEGKLEKELSETLIFSTDDLLEEIKTGISESINKEYIKGVKLNAKIVKMIPQHVYLQKEGMISSFSTVGDIKLTIDGFLSVN